MHWLRPLLLALAMIPLVGCMTWKRVPVYRISTTIKAKDTVRLQMMDGRKMQFVVSQVEPVALLGKDIRVHIGDIDWLEKGKDETLLYMGIGAVVVAGVVVVVGVVALVVSAAAADFDLAGGGMIGSR